MIRINDDLHIDPKLVVGTTWDFHDGEDADEIHFIIHMRNNVSIRVRHERSHLSGLMGGFNALALEKAINDAKTE